MKSNSKTAGYIILAAAALIFVSVLFIPVGLTEFIASAGEIRAEENPGKEDEDEETVEEIKAQIDELTASLADLSESKDELYEKLREVTENKEAIESRYLADKLAADAETQIIELRIDVYNDIIGKYDYLMSVKQTEIDAIQAEFDAMYGVFSERMRQSYEEGVPSTLEIFFNSESFIEMLTSIERMSDILEHDRQVMSSLEEYQNEKNAEKAVLQGYYDEQMGVIQKLEEEKAVLDAKLQASLNAIDLENSNIDEYLHLLQIAEQDEELMNEMLVQAIKEYHDRLGAGEQDKYETTEEYKRAAVLPGIIEKMENGEIMKGSEYFLDGDDYIWPLPMSNYYKNFITSTFGYRTYTNSSGHKVSDYHSGYDLRSPKGTEIYACRSGRVVTATYNASYGYYIDILHEDGAVTRYAHCSKILVVVGEYVLQGENIALVGSTGNATGNHVHLEVRIGGSAKNPSGYVRMPTERQ